MWKSVLLIRTMVAIGTSVVAQPAWTIHAARVACAETLTIALGALTDVLVPEAVQPCYWTETTRSSRARGSM
jgi:hypothetical protein